MEKFKIYNLVIFRENKLLILFSLFFLLLGTGVGYLFHSQIKENDDKSEVYIPTDVGELLMNNIQAIGMIALGIFTFGILTIILLVSNGMFIGLTIRGNIADGIPISEVILKLIPHGIFEVPAIIISGIIGLKSLEVLIKVTLSKQPIKTKLKSAVWEIFILSILLIFLIVLAAFIEIYITP